MGKSALTRSRLAVFAAIALMLTLAPIVNAAYGDVRYSGVTALTLTVDTQDINTKILASDFPALGQAMVLYGAGSISGSSNDWIVGSFVYRGKLASQAPDNSKSAELTLQLGGLSIERELHRQGSSSYIAGALAGIGSANLSLGQGRVENFADARLEGHSSSLNTVLWFVEPYGGMRIHFNENIALEARLGFAMSMSNGEWKNKGASVGSANFGVGGSSLLIGAKISSF